MTDAFHHISRIGCLLAATCLSSPAWSQDAHDPAHAANAEAALPDDIVVAGHPPLDFALLASTATLEDDRLVQLTRSQLGEVLASLPGVSATSFSPGASRPVLRGMDGDRIRVLLDGIGSIDASSVSADHAVVFDPLTVDHIDVLHGPAVLLFGGQAIGGAVNALDKRIPRSVPDRLQVTALAGYGSAADERSAGAAVQIPLDERFVAHVDASWRKSDDLRVSGFVNSAALRSELLADAQIKRADGFNAEALDLEGLAALRDRIPNTGTRNTTFGAGLAFIDAGGNLGVSFQRQDMRYGVPLRPGSGAEPDPVSIDLVQTRIDLRAAVEFDGLIDSLQLRGAYGDYRHAELEGTNIGTSFAGKGIEFRADLVQSERGGWRGRSGVQWFDRKLSVVGDEAVFPDNTISRFGVFTLQSLRLGAVELEGAARYERSNVRAQPVAFQRSYGLWSGAAGLTFRPAPGWKLGASYLHGARAPAPEELLSDGLHIATQAYELGDPTFRPETSNGGEAWVRYDGGRYTLAVTGYLTNFNDFIAAVPTGLEVDGFPVFQYTQLPARFRGFEAEARAKVLRWADGELALDVQADCTHAQLTGIGPVPRIPPLRLRGGTDLKHGNLGLRAEVEWNAAQNRVAALENPVAAFTLVNLSADWHPLGEDGALTVLLAANNLFNVEARRAASFTRDFVPLSGRDLRVTVKLSF